MDEKKRFAERLTAAMEAAGFEPRPAVLEKQFNSRYWGPPVTYQAARRWLLGLSLPEQDKLQVIADWLHVDPHALRFGTPAERRLNDPRRHWADSLSRDDRMMVEAFLKLSQEQQRLVRDLIELFRRRFG